MAKQRGLGIGLEALFADNDTAGEQGTVTLKLSEIEPNREQPRKRFDEEALTQLAESIRIHGVIQPLLVRPAAGGTYQLVAGERRWRAARMAGLTEVPAVIKELSEQEAMELALIENLQREDLNPIEEALGYQELMDAYGFTQEQVAKRVGKSRSAVANALRLISLPEEIRPMLEEADDAAVEAQKAATREIMDKLPLAKFSTEKFGGDVLMKAFNSDKWASLSEACLGCGTCTFVCPTCQCYDIRDYDTGHGIQRFRCWDSCMYSDFTLMAGGQPRLTQKERFRQRFMHKLVYFPANNNGEYGCVGCGRCLSKCPISMNIVKVAKSLEGDL